MKKLRLPYTVVVAQKGVRGFVKTNILDPAKMTICDNRFGRTIGRRVTTLFDAVIHLSGALKGFIKEPVFLAHKEVREKIFTHLETIGWDQTDPKNPVFEGVLVGNRGVRYWVKVDASNCIEKIQLIKQSVVTAVNVPERRGLASHAAIIPMYKRHQLPDVVRARSAPTRRVASMALAAMG